MFQSDHIKSIADDLTKEQTEKKMKRKKKQADESKEN